MNREGPIRISTALAMIAGLAATAMIAALQELAPTGKNPLWEGMLYFSIAVLMICLTKVLVDNCPMPRSFPFNALSTRERHRLLTEKQDRPPVFDHVVVKGAIVDGIRIREGADVVLTNVEAYGNGRDGVHVEGNGRVTMDAIKAHDNGRHGVYVADGKTKSESR
jgi:parallel beta helix pectate lyase-like protein